ncbi:MAG TPA: hypothetical protein VGN01_08860 [Acidobacteriaceae bacterium]
MATESHLEGHARQPLLAWAPLLTGTFSSYGGIAFNYGFALYFLNYRHGFVKRGLVGELFSGVAFLPRTHLLAIEYLFLAAAFGLTYAVFRGMLFGSPSECRLAAALLSAPALLPHLGFLFAQPDVTLYILLLGCLALFLRATPGVATAASCVLCCVSLLAHEAFSLMFYPLVVAILWHLCAKRRLPWLAAAAHVLVVAGVFAAVVHWGTLKVSPDAMLQEASARTDVGIQRQVYDVMASTLQQQEVLVRQMYSPSGLKVLLGVTLLFSAPYFALLARLLHGAMRGAEVGRVRAAGTGLLFVSPLLLCALGHDVSRWLGAMGIDATLMVLYLYLAEPPESATRRYLRDWADSPGFLTWLVYLVAVGPFGATGIRSAELLVQAWLGG